MYTLGIYDNRTLVLKRVIPVSDNRRTAERVKLSEVVASAGVRTVCLIKDIYPPLTVRRGLDAEWYWRTCNATGVGGLKSVVGCGIWGN